MIYSNRLRTKYVKLGVMTFCEEKNLEIKKDITSLMINLRNMPAICEFSNKLFREYVQTTSGNRDKIEHN